MTSAACIVLAAGLGTRMKSSIPKALHGIAGRSLLAHVLSSAVALRPERLVVVVGSDMQAVGDEALRIAPEAGLVVQPERLGTAHAVRAALPAVKDFGGPILVLCGDTPLVREETLEAMVKRIVEGADVTVLGFEASDPFGYGRLVRNEDGTLAAVREEADASAEERRINLCNSGVMSFAGATFGALIEGVGNDNSQGEFYLTDVVELAARDGLNVTVERCDEDEAVGINGREGLALAESILQKALRARAMENGATLVAPETVFFSFDTRLGRDVVVEPHVIFGPKVVVEDGASVHGFSHLENCIVRRGASIGPHARLRPGADIGENGKVGNFVEVKEAVVEAGAKINHLAYVGDARVGEGANVGAGAVTCNYDGVSKHRTDIGAGAFIGSNSSLIAPVRIGDGAYVGSGSVISTDVKADSLAVARAKQVVRERWAARRRAAAAAGKSDD